MRFLVILLLNFSVSALAELKVGYDSDLQKNTVDSGAALSSHPHSKLKLARGADRNFAILFTPTQQTRQEVQTVGLIATHFCSAGYVEVLGKTILLTVNHCLHSDTVFDAYFLGFEGAYTLNNFMFNQVNPRDEFDSKNIHFDIAMFVEESRSVLSSPYFKPLRLAKSLPKLNSKLRMIGYPDGFGPVEVSCPYKGKFVGAQENHPEWTVRGMMHCDLPRDTDLDGMSGSLILNDKNEVVGVFKSILQIEHTYKTIFSIILDGDIELDSKGNPYLSMKTQVGRVQVDQLKEDGSLFQCQGTVLKEGYVDGVYKCNKNGKIISGRFIRGILQE